MTQPKFPWVLLVIIAMFTFVAVSPISPPWIVAFAIVAVIISAAAAIYQVFPRKDRLDHRPVLLIPTVVTYAQLESWVRTGGEPLVVRTSGSSGEPKDVVLPHSAMLASARATLDRLGGPGHWLLALPVSGIAGIQVLVRSALAGREPVSLADHPSLRSAIDALDASDSAVRRRRTYAALPLGGCRRAWRAGGTRRRPGRRGFARSRPAVARPKPLAIRLIRTYGMTETCGGCVYDGVPLDGVELARSMRTARSWLRGPMVFDGYAAIAASPSWFATADRGRILDDGRLQVLGRMDETVVSGGVNVPLPAVEDVVRRASGVATAAVVGVPDAEWGTRVVAVVVPAAGASVDLDALRDAVEAAGLARTWAPRQLLDARRNCRCSPRERSTASDYASSRPKRPRVSRMQFRAFAIAMPIRFRGVGRREGMLVNGDAGWGEFSPFLEYGAAECVPWLQRRFRICRSAVAGARP